MTDQTHTYSCRLLSKKESANAVFHISSRYFILYFPDIDFEVSCSLNDLRFTKRPSPSPSPSPQRAPAVLIAAGTYARFWQVYVEMDDGKEIYRLVEECSESNLWNLPANFFDPDDELLKPETTP